MRTGYLSQEPQLDANKTVRENVMEGVAKKQALVDRFNEIAANYSDETADEMARLQDEIEAQGLWDLDSKVDQAMDAAALSRWRHQMSRTLSEPASAAAGVALCKLLLDTRPISCCWTNPPTIWTQVRGLAGAEPCGSTKAASSWSPMTAIFLDNVTGWILELDRGQGHST